MALEDRKDDVIGGVGETVEIDESKLFKRKYHKGRVLSMQEGWVFGGICRRTKRRFVVRVPDRSEETLLPIIQAHIKPGTHIMSDEWKAYYNLDKHGYIHQKINHSKRFVDEFDRNIHTQRIENSWRYLKATYPKNGTSESLRDGYIHEYLYRSIYAENIVDQFFADMRKYYPWKCGGM